MWNEHCTSIFRYIFFTCLLRVDYFLFISYNEAFIPAWPHFFNVKYISISVVHGMPSYSLWQHVLFALKYAGLLPPWPLSLSLPLSTWFMSATPNGRKRKRRRNGRRRKRARRNGRKRRKEEEEVERRRDGVRSGRGRGRRGWGWNDKYRMGSAAAWSRGLYRGDEAEEERSSLN